MFTRDTNLPNRTGLRNNTYIKVALLSTDISRKKKKKKKKLGFRGEKSDRNWHRVNVVPVASCANVLDLVPLPRWTASIRRARSEVRHSTSLLLLLEMKYFLFLTLVALAAAQFPFRGRPQGFRPRPSQGFGGGSGRNGGGADGRNGQSEYHYSWLHDGGRKYPHGQAIGYCNGLGGGWGPVGIESGGESNFINGVISSHRQEYIWTGGVQQGAGWGWINGGPFNGINWSHTGGNRVPQPDNREGNEACLAVLNDFYRDGIKWHDVACHHTKPIICERRV
ncbi:uncharacterized protein [Macrobrachium rosenbergii]|uniref:uncharacterized protein n=1 Tax=Macrobrachium rosenbergii TaxID=79674 RepID=UPI0034D3E7FD